MEMLSFCKIEHLWSQQWWVRMDHLGGEHEEIAYSVPWAIHIHIYICRYNLGYLKNIHWGYIISTLGIFWRRPIELLEFYLLRFLADGRTTFFLEGESTLSVDEQIETSEKSQCVVDIHNFCWCNTTATFVQPSFAQDSDEVRPLAVHCFFDVGGKDVLGLSL